MAQSKSLKTAVKSAVKGAQQDAKTGDVKTQDTSTAPSPQPSQDLPTGARSHPPA